MPYIATGFYEASVEIDVPGDAGPAYVVFGGTGGALGNASDIGLALEAILDNAAGFKGMLSSFTTIQKVVTRYRTGPATVEIAENTIASPGVNGSEPPPPQVSTLIQKISGLAGRENRGRMYLPAPQESAIASSGLWDVGFLGALQGAASTFLADLVVSSIDMHILHTSQVLPPTTVNALNVSPKVATQRRRLR